MWACAPQGGGYIVFVDADDWLTRNSIKTLYTKVKNEDADLCFGNFWRVLVSGAKFSNFYCESAFGMDDLAALENFMGTVFTPWAKIFKRSCIKGVFPTDVAVNEDSYFVCECLLNSKKVATVSNGVYYYNHLNDSSLTQRYYPDLNRYYVKPLEFRCRLFHQKLPIKEQEKITELLLVAITHYISHLTKDEAILKIAETLSMFSSYLDKIDLREIEHSKNKYASNFYALSQAFEHKDYEKIYSELQNQEKSSAVKKIIRKLVLPFLQFLVFKLQLGYKG